VTLNIFTIVLDGAPWLGAQFAELTRLRDIKWHWSIVEGASMAQKDTSWMANQGNKISHDGTHQLLQSFANHPRITVKSKPTWDGKTEMINAALTSFKNDGVLLQMDCDELWTSKQMATLVGMFEGNIQLSTLQVSMDYMVGPNVIATSTNGYGNRDSEWVRAWRYGTGMWMECHEPPVFNGNGGRVYSRDDAYRWLGKILHMSWVTPQQVAQKQRIYGKPYAKAIDNWLSLQNNTNWPVNDLQQFLPWVGSGGSADLLFKD
jgi:hypothetical protein